ncbi:small multi-drug export protein [uncultured Methanoregula sp.]|uniref:small multi-drug export protein n=1 Tax=uncultured Methanoregula sp. TaxID=1005933 RepID=UPI002AAA9857|nr:small multi-drug export protein [uncultured Methanoregula sp.]
MEPGKISTVLRRLARALARCVLVAILLPLLPVLFLGIPLAATLTVITTGFIIEYGAAPVGLALGLSPWIVFYILMCTETGIFLGLYDIFNTIGETSPPVARFLEKTHQYSRSSKSVERYGILALVPCEILIGVYFCAPVSWVLGWRENRALLVTMTGYVLSLIITIILTMGLFGVLLP